MHAKARSTLTVLLAVVIVTMTMLGLSATSEESDSPGLEQASGNVGVLSCGRVRSFGSEPHERERFLSENIGAGFNLQRAPCDNKDASYLVEHFLEAGFRKFDIHSFCADKHSRYVTDATRGLENVSLTVVAINEPVGFQQHIIVLPDGRLQLNYNSWRCADKNFYELELPT